jgi:ATP-dependent Lon protease
LDLFLELPWNVYSKDNFDLKRAEKILDRTIWVRRGKERMIEHLAVLKLRNDMKSPIICLTGPPGVGKTSIGRSVAEALGREYVRISLEVCVMSLKLEGIETYIVRCGKNSSKFKRLTSNPVFVLDEIDKLSVSSQGDPSSALLEVLILSKTILL